MKVAVFGVVAGVVVATAGASITEQPIKTIVLICVLVLSHHFCGANHG